MSEISLTEFSLIAGLMIWGLLNGLTYLVFAEDKERAHARMWRISESTLLTLSLIGGSLGAKIAQKRLRHKTRKQPFGLILNAICVLHVGLIIAVILTIAGFLPV